MADCAAQLLRKQKSTQGTKQRQTALASTRTRTISLKGWLQTKNRQHCDTSVMAQVEIAMSSLIAEDLFPSTSTKESWALSKTACGRAMAQPVARPSQSTGESSWIPPRLPHPVLSAKLMTPHLACGTETQCARPLRIATAHNVTTRIGCPILSHSARNS